VDWKRLVEFALLGSSDLEQYAILLVRVSLGLFFAISGANKLFVAGGRQTMYETLVQAKVPFPHLMTYFVSGVEFVGGFSAAMSGKLSRIVVPIPNVLSTVRRPPCRSTISFEM
jgi:putative oxidoreductase